MDQGLLAGLSPSWPMVGLLSAFFIYLVRLGFNVNKLLDSLNEHKRDVDERFDESHKQMASWINNNNESKIKPLESGLLQLEKEQSRLHVAISDEYKVLRQQNADMVKELGEVKVFMATMNERWKNISRRGSDQC